MKQKIITCLLCLSLLPLSGCSGSKYVIALDVFQVVFAVYSPVLPVDYNNQVTDFVIFSAAELQSNDAAGLQLEKVFQRAVVLSLTIPETSDPKVRAALLATTAALEIFIHVFPGSSTKNSITSMRTATMNTAEPTLYLPDSKRPLVLSHKDRTMLQNISVHSQLTRRK